MTWVAFIIGKKCVALEARFSFPLIFLLFAVLWIGAFWPALSHAWWFMDDLWAIEWTNAQRWGRFVVGNGRPLLGLWSYSFVLDRTGDDQLVNILLRWFQGGVHVLNATLIARLLYDVVKSWSAILATLLFLLWPFNADSVLWRGGSLYAIAALLSLLGLYLIRLQGLRRDRLSWGIGAGLCALSMLATQATAFASLVVWIALVAMAALQPVPMPWPRLRREAMFLAIGIVTGAAISYCFIKIYPLPSSWNRSQLVTDFGKKLRFLVELNQHMIVFPGFYPFRLKLAHVLLLATALGAIVVCGRSVKGKSNETVLRLLLVFCCLTLCLILPYTAQLVVAESGVFLRTIYLGPLIFTACWLVAFQLFQKNVWLQRGYVLLLGSILLCYWPMARKHASEYVECYKSDLADLRRIEQRAAELGLNRVMVVPGMDFSLYNPHHFKYFMLCTHNSSLATPWVRELFIRNRSKLQPVCQPEDMYLLARGEIDQNKTIMRHALEQKKTLPLSSELQLRKIDGYDIMGVFMP